MLNVNDEAADTSEDERSVLVLVADVKMMWTGQFSSVRPWNLQR